MRLLNKIANLTQILFLGVLLLAISSGCCLQHEYRKTAQDASKQSKHDCCKKNTEQQDRESGQTCLDCDHGSQLMQASGSELVKVKFTVSNWPDILVLSVNNFSFLSDFREHVRGINFSNAPNQTYSQLIHSLKISPNAPPSII